MPRYLVVIATSRRGGEAAAEDADAEKHEPNSLVDGDDKFDIPTFLRKHLD